MAAGDHHSLALHANGTVFAFGLNLRGELGLAISGTSVVSTPTVIPNLTGVVSIAAGAYHSLAAKTDGTLYGWGSNDIRQFGPSPLLSQYSAPVIVPSTPGVRTVGAGYENSTELLTNGTVYRTGTGTGQAIVAGLNSVTTAISGAYTAIVLRSPASRKVIMEFESASSSGREGTTDSVRLLVKGTVITPQTVEVIKTEERSTVLTTLSEQFQSRQALMTELQRRQSLFQFNCWQMFRLKTTKPSRWPWLIQPRS